MATEKEIKEKWAEVLDYAREHATGTGMHQGYKWLQDAYEEYLEMSEEVGGYNMGGQKKCIKAACGMEPLKDWHKEIAPKLYDRINREWHS